MATSREETARKAAAKYSVPRAYAGYASLVSDPDVELVIVSVKLPAHYEIVRAAIEAGKHIYCEWPLGIDADEAADLAARAAARGVHSMVGLQARQSPVLNHAGALIAEGRIGDVLSVSVVASAFGWGPVIEPGNAYLFDARNGATMDVIAGGHLLDALINIFGDLDRFSVMLETLRRETGVISLEDLQRFRAFQATLAFPGEAVDETDPEPIRVRETFVPTSPDQMLLQGVMGGRIPISLHIRGGTLRGSGLLIEITGTKGELRISGPAGVVQMVPLKLEGGWGTQPVFHPILPPAEPDDDALTALGPIASNIARAYGRFARDIRAGTRTVPDFALAADRQKLLRKIATAAASGQRATRGRPS